MLEVEGVSAGYGNVQALWDLDLTVGEGEVVCLLGRNGAGKSTTLKVASGLVAPWSGRVTLDGSDVTRMPPEERLALGLALVPEGRGMLPSFTVRENLQMGGYVRRLTPSAQAEETERVTEVFPRLRERMDQAAGSLSGGEQQMLAVARALVSRPRVLLIDEPSLGLAPVVVEQLYDLFRRLNGEGLTLLLVEQYAELALEMATRAYVLEKGKIVVSGQGEQLAQRDDLLAAYLG